MNVTIERIHQILGNLIRSYNIQETYADDDDPLMGILAAEMFAVRTTYQYMILPINHLVN